MAENPPHPTIGEAFQEHLEENGHKRTVNKSVDDWLPVTGDRHAKWWYSAFHNVTAMVGAGVLGLPAMTFLTWGPGVTVLVLSCLITLYTLWQMVEMHEMVENKRFDRYHELGQGAFGEKLGLWVVVPQQLIVDVGVDIVYMVTGGISLQGFYQIVCKGHCPLYSHKSAWIAIFASVHFFLSQLPNFNSIAGISLVAACMSLSYSTIAWCVPAAYGHSHPPLMTGQYADYHLPKQSKVAHVFNAFNALGTVAFAYAGHNVVLEIQATIPSTKERPSKVPMWRGVVLAYTVVAICYFPVSFVGYWAYGNHIDNNILLYIDRPGWLIAAANLMVVVHVTGSYQIYALPVFDMIESVLVRRLRLKPSFKLRLIARSTYVDKWWFKSLANDIFALIFTATIHVLRCAMRCNIFWSDVMVQLSLPLRPLHSHSSQLFLVSSADLPSRRQLTFCLASCGYALRSQRDGVSAGC